MQTQQMQELKTIGVVGLGLLGRGIVACFLGHGFRVIGFARNEAEHAEARPIITQMAEELGATDWRSRYTETTDFENFRGRGCEFIAESVTEDLATKELVYDQLEAVVSPSAIIASNTSAIPISVLQQKRKHPGRFVGMHWAEPAHTTRFVELIRGDQTSTKVFEAAAAIARRLGKEPTLCRRDVPGFIVNRIGYAMYREAMHLVETGVADVETIDNAIRNTIGLWCGLCGPMRWIDLSGGPAMYAKAMEPVLPTLSNATALPPVLKRLADDGGRGIVNGRGFYRYTPDEANAWRELHHRHVATVTRMIEEYFPLTPKDEAK